MTGSNWRSPADIQPTQLPEGALLQEGREAVGLTFRAAASLADISAGRWRQVEKGYQNASPGNYGAVRGPARTLARMAAAVGVTADQMEKAGREDVAAILRVPAPDPAPAPDPVPASRYAPASFDKVETHVWQGPGTKQERAAMVAAYREVRYRQWAATTTETTEGSLA